MWHSFANCQGNVFLTMCFFLKKMHNTSGDPLLLKEMLLSIPDHMSNVHTFSENSCYTACPHGPLTGDRGKAWLPPDSLVRIPLDGYLSQPDYNHRYNTTQISPPRKKEQNTSQKI